MNLSYRLFAKTQLTVTHINKFSHVSGREKKVALLIRRKNLLAPSRRKNPARQSCLEEQHGPKKESHSGSDNHHSLPRSNHTVKKWLAHTRTTPPPQPPTHRSVALKYKRRQGHDDIASLIGQAGRSKQTALPPSAKSDASRKNAFLRHITHSMRINTREYTPIGSNMPSYR